MHIESAAIIFFSPTGATQKILQAVSLGLGIGQPRRIDLTPAPARLAGRYPVAEDIVLIGVPVYGERIPDIIKPCLEKLEGRGQPAVLIAVYGNVGYGVALQELDILASHAGFTVAAAASYIGEHSFSTDRLPAAPRRPDRSDTAHAQLFGMKIREKLRKLDLPGDIGKLKLPGRLPLAARLLPKNSARLFTREPDADMDLCTRCGICVRECPMSAIDPETLRIHPQQCLRCFACVRKCPRQARKIVLKKSRLVSKVLKRKTKKRREPLTFL